MDVDVGVGGCVRGRENLLNITGTTKIPIRLSNLNHERKITDSAYNRSKRKSHKSIHPKIVAAICGIDGENFEKNNPDEKGERRRKKESKKATTADHLIKIYFSFPQTSLKRIFSRKIKHGD